jgi:hypothetical protein
MASIYTTEQKKVVARIIKLRKSGKGYPAIAAALNEARVPTFGREGATWYGPTVRHICIRELGSAEESLKVAGTTRPTAKKAAAKKPRVRRK